MHVQNAPVQEFKLEGPHKYVKVYRGLLTCDYCGHIFLRNNISMLVDRLGCGYREHPKFKAWLKSINKND